MKKLLRFVLALVLLVIVGLVVVYFYRNSIIRSTVESQASSSLGVKTTLGGANLSLFGGSLELSKLDVSSPQGYSAPQMFSLDSLNLGVNYGDLRKTPIRVREISLSKPRVMLEIVNGKPNFQAMMDKMGGTAGAPQPNPAPTQSPVPQPNPAPPQTPVPQQSPTPQKDDSIRLIIENLTIAEPQVVLRAPPLVTSDLTLNLPTLNLKKIGNADGAENGAAIKDVVAAVMSRLAAEASASGQLNAQISKLLSDSASQVMGQVSAELQKQVNSVTKNVTDQMNKAVGDIGKNLPGGADLGKIIPGGGDVGKIIPGGKDPGKAIDDGLKNLIPGGKKKDDKK